MIIKYRKDRCYGPSNNTVCIGLWLHFFGLAFMPLLVILFSGVIDADFLLGFYLGEFKAFSHGRK